MCGACGEPGTVDWARPFVAGLPARLAVAAALTARLVRPGPKITARAGGWLVSAPTGATMPCSALTELVTAARAWLGEPVEFRPHAGGALAEPEPDARQGVTIRVDPGRAPRGLGNADVVVPDDDAARDVLTALARPPWSLRRFLTGIDGVREPWGADARVVRADAAADLVVWAEHARQAGRFDDSAVRLESPVGGRTLDVEIRAGHVVRARAC